MSDGRKRKTSAKKHVSEAPRTLSYDSIMYTSCTGSELPCKVTSNDPFNGNCIPLGSTHVPPYEETKGINPVLGDIPIASVAVP